MNKTLKEIADELGIDKQKVYRYVKKNHINEVLQSASVKQYDEVAQKQIISHFLKQNSINEAHQNHFKSTSNDAVYDALLKQLETKDKQIQRLQDENDNLQKLLDQEQQLNAMAQQKLQLLEQKQEEPPKRKWYEFFKD